MSASATHRAKPDAISIMTRQDIKRLAQAAGFHFPDETSTSAKGMMTRLERFARLVETESEQWKFQSQAQDHELVNKNQAERQ